MSSRLHILWNMIFYDIISLFFFLLTKQYSTTTAVTRVINNITEVLDKGHYCVSLFIDLSKVSNAVNLKTKLKQIGLSNDTTSWFES